MKKFVMAAILMVFGFALFSGCANAAVMGETAGEAIDDATMHSQVTAIIIKDPDAHYFKVDVNVTQGEVVLTGFVNSRETEERLISKIREIKGVKSVRSILKMEERK